MCAYGQVPKGEARLAQINRQTQGKFEFQLFPELWAIEEIREYYAEKTWKHTKFLTEPEIEIPETSGIYMFIVSPRSGGISDHSYIFYVGKAKNLKNRYKKYLEEQKGKGTNPRDKVIRFLDYFAQHLEFHFTEIPEAELTKAENLLKDNITPPANTQVKIIGRLMGAS